MLNVLLTQRRRKMTDDAELNISDVTLIARLRGACYLAFDDGTNDYGTAPEAADRIEKLVATNEALTEQLAAARDDAKEAEAYAEEVEKERERLALAICGGEDAPGYANAQTVETLEKVARDWAMGMMEQINRTLALEAKLAKAVEALEDMLTIPNSEAAQGIIKAYARALIAELTGGKDE
jgi:hypothetical protein